MFVSICFYMYIHIYIYIICLQTDLHTFTYILFDEGDNMPKQMPKQTILPVGFTNGL